MLSQLKVQNFAIIDNLTVEFTNGFTTLTGETGAGKSLIIDAIGLLFGDRSNISMIRSGETKAIVEGIFEDVSLKTIQVLQELQIELLEGNIVVIKRELATSGKSLIRVNGEIITLTQLEMLASTLGDIHTQDATHKLFHQQNYLTFIENEDVNKELLEYQILRRKYLECYQTYQTLQNLSETDASNLEFWEFQLQELKKANLKLGEEENLEAELRYLNNFENIYKNLALISEEFSEHNILEHLYEVISSLEKLQKYQEETYKTDYQKIQDSYYELEDFDSRIKNQLKNMDFDETTLNAINDRLSFLNFLKHKYHKNIKELLSYQAELRTKIEDFEQVDYKIENARKDLEKSFNNLKEKALALSSLRKQSAKELELHILTTLNDLMLNKVQFQIFFQPYSIEDVMDKSVFKPNGCDDIDILISFNVGESLKSVSKVASGGEMSRIMLALKVHFLKKLQLSTIVFDEIDSGVSGSVAGKVAEKLKEISQTTQVLAITHLPIVASYSNHQYQIYKEFTKNHTMTKIKELTEEERMIEIAEMISPNDVTSKSKELAKLMLENNK